MATASQLAQKAVNEASLQSAATSKEAVAELRHLRGIADKLLVAQEDLADDLAAALQAGQAAVGQKLDGVRAELGGVRAELAALRRQERVACLQRGRMIVRDNNGVSMPNSARLLDWALGQLLRGLPAVDLEVFSQWFSNQHPDSSYEEQRAEFLSELEGLTGLRFRLAKNDKGNWCLHEQQQ